MSETITIEQAGWRDLGAVRRLEQVCFPKDAWPLWDIIGVLSFSNVVRLKAVTESGLVVGFVAGDIHRAEGISWIATIGVLPEYQGRGIGRRLLEACEAQLPTRSVRLCVRKENMVAIGLYLRSGYVRISEWRRYYQDGADAVVMEKNL